jgi:ketosteroid isomerase-like protein
MAHCRHVPAVHPRLTLNSRADTVKAVVAANAAFYDAFVNRDLAAMDRLWAEQAAVACIHPGWDVLVGRDDVLESWRRILSQPTAPEIAHRDAHVMVHDGCALVTCQELIAGVTLAATNAFVYESGRWRMVMHQASQVARAAPWQDTPPTGAVH